MSQQIQITGGAKVRNLEGVLTGTAGVVNSLGINVPDGIPQLDGSGKILVSQLPNSVMEYKGTWDAATNTPTLANGTGNAGDVYLCNVAGTTDFGAGPITFAVGDQVLYSGTTWEKASGATGTVTSVAVTESGDALTITGSPITTSGTINIGFAGTGSQYIKGDGTLATFPTTIDQAKRLITEVYNSTGATLTKGTVVYINGGQGNLPTITKAQANADNTSAQTYGVVQSDITNNNNGFVVVLGSLTDLDTQAYSVGTQLYLSGTTAGEWTSTKPSAPIHLVYVGIVVRSHPTQGVVEIRIQNGYELEELHDVAISSVANNDGIFYNSSNDLWENKTIDEALGYTPANDSLVVKLAGTQTITGSKTFSIAPRNDGGILLKDGVTTGSNGYVSVGSNGAGLTIGVYNSGTTYFHELLMPYSASYNYTFPAATGTLALTSNLSAYVPYTGATSNLDLGGYSLYLNNSQAVFGRNLAGSTAYALIGVNGSNKVSIDTSGLGVVLGGALSGTSATFSSNVSAIADSNAVAFIAQARTADDLAQISFKNNANSNTNALISVLKVGTNGGQIQFITKPDGSSLAAALTLASTGAATFSSSVGINGGDFRYRPNGDVTNSPALVLKSPTAGVLSVCAEVIGVANADSNSLSFRVSNVTSGRFDALTIASTGAATFSGSVSVGGASTGQLLSVSSSTTNAARVRVTGTGTTAGNFRGYEFGATSGFKGGLLQDESTDLISIFTPIGGQSFNITSSGNVGIGTSSPSEKLDVIGGAVAAGNGTIRTGITYSSLGLIGTFTNHDLGVITNGSERMRITSGGNVAIGTTSASARLNIQSDSSTSYQTLTTGAAGASFGTLTENFHGDFLIYYSDLGGWNEAGATTKFGKLSSTGRSINAGGTINASGADYAEYMTKAIEETIEKGDIVGIDLNGLLTNIFNNAISFAVKSTNPSYVGGDIWGIEIEDEIELETARQKVDRIAFSGQIPCNVYGANVGDYIIPIELDGKISGKAVSNPTFEQYQISVGKVWKIMEDGRAWIAVKIG